MTLTKLLVRLSRFSDRRPRQPVDYVLRFLCVAALIGCLLVPLALSMHQTEVADRSPCLDYAGMPGQWDCQLGRRVDEWGPVGSGLTLPLP